MLEIFTTHDFTDEIQVSKDPADVRLVFETGHVADFSAVQVGWIFMGCGANQYMCGRGV